MAMYLWKQLTNSNVCGSHLKACVIILIMLNLTLYEALDILFGDSKLCGIHSPEVCL